jgi:hypothetical protein
MLKLIILFFFMLLNFSTVAEELRCFEIDDVEISELHPNIHMKESIERRKIISVRKEINCKTNDVIIPSTYDEALEMLDFSLPLDYKSAAVSGSSSIGYTDSSVYRNSDYGSSVDSDLFHYFQKNWMLDGENNVCKEKASEKHDWDEEGCFWILVDELIVSYQKGLRGKVPRQ